MSIRKSGGYRKLASFQSATLIYDATYWFCEKFLDSRSRTVDQMVQAARSRRQNIAEGSRASATSSQTELRLVNAARASMEELLLDYEDFLRHRRLPMWTTNSPEASAVRCVPKRFREDRSVPSDPTDLTDHQRWSLYAKWLDHDDPTVRANAVICVIHQCIFYWTSKSRRWRNSLSPRVDTANNWPLRGSPKERSNEIRQIGRIRPIRRI